MTNNKLTDERLSVLATDLAACAIGCSGHETQAMARELQEYRKAAPVEINDEMAFAFCHALSDDAVGADEVEDIKTGLRAAFANITTPQPAPAVEVKPIAFFDGDISPADAEKLTAAIRELNNAPSEPAMLAAVEAVPVVMKGHQIRELVNELRDIAVEYHGTHQLRERIARTLRTAMLQSFGNSEQLNSPVIPDGWVMVPVEPTEDMVIDGFESEPDETFSKPEVWEEYQAMTGCQQAAYRAKLCWSAMLAAAPQQEVNHKDAAQKLSQARGLANDPDAVANSLIRGFKK